MIFQKKKKRGKEGARVKILHTSDWHVGKRLMGRERLAEQAEVLDEIVELCEVASDEHVGCEKR